MSHDAAVAADFAVWLGVFGSLLVVVFFGCPWIAHLAFQERMQALRDECVDAILDDRLSDCAATEDFIGMAEFTVANAKLCTLPHVYAMHAASSSLGVTVPSGPSYADLAPQERHLMHALDSRAEAAWRSHLMWGSPLGWFVGLTLKWRERKRKRPATLTTLARECMVSTQTHSIPEHKHLLTI